MCRDIKDFQLSDEATDLILSEMKNFLGGQELNGFVQALITLPDKRTVLAVDSRARRIDFESLPAVKILDASNFTVIVGRGSCTITTVSGGYVQSWLAPDWMCT